MQKSDAFILIGGRSSRLGADKALVMIGGRTLMQRAVDTARVALPDARITAVAGNETQFALQAVAAGVRFIFDLHEGRGPLGGLHAALADARTPWVFVLACDYPFVSPELIGRLVDRISDEHGAVVPQQDDGRLQPLCAFYRVDDALPLVEEFIVRPRPSPSMREIVDRLNPLIVRVDEYSHLPGSENFFININTIEDLENARRRT